MLLHRMIPAVVLTWAVLLATSWLGWQLLRQNGRILLRLDELEKRLNELEFGGAEEPQGLPLRSETPAFELPDLAGERKSLAQFRGQPVLLIFFNPDCGFCREMMPKLAAHVAGSTGHWPVPPGDSPGGIVSAPADTSDLVPQPGPAGVPFGGSPNGAGRSPSLPRVLILTTGDTEKNRQFFTEHKIACPVLLQNDGEVAKAYQANGTPTGYLIGADGKIASALAIGAEALLKLASQSAQELPLNPALSPSDGEREKNGDGGDGRVDRFSQRSLARSKLKRDGLKAGTPAPDFRLPRLDGRGDLTLSELRGKPVLLVFSSPGCGPCNALAPELEKFHRQNGNSLRPPSRHSIRTSVTL